MRRTIPNETNLLDGVSLIKRSYLSVWCDALAVTRLASLPVPREMEDKTHDQE